MAQNIDNSNSLGLDQHLERPLLPPQRQKRFPEYQFWFINFRSLVVSIMCTCIPFLDVPVDWRFLAVYGLFLALFEGARLIHRHREATVVVSDTNINPLLSFKRSSIPSRNSVQIRLVMRPRSSPTAIAITHITPWHARQPPLFFQCTDTESPDDWQSFLQDIELAMETDGEPDLRALKLLGICGILIFVGMIVGYHLDRWATQYFPCHISRICTLDYVVAMIALAPPMIYYVQATRAMREQTAKELMQHCEKVQRICDDFRVEHPTIWCRAKVVQTLPCHILVTVQHHASQI
jgi:hypothetical protein